MGKTAAELQIQVDRSQSGLEILVDRPQRDIRLDVNRGGGEELPAYEGPYTVVSGLHEAQTMATKGRKMTGNVTVQPISITYADNAGGGKTVTIGAAEPG